jgi:hypothetical protein
MSRIEQLLEEIRRKQQNPEDFMYSVVQARECCQKKEGIKPEVAARI